MAERPAPGVGPESAERASRVREPQFGVASAGTSGAARRTAGPPHALLALQRSAGNAAVASMLAGRRRDARSAAPQRVAPAPVPEADGPAGALDGDRVPVTDVTAAVGDGGSTPPRGRAATEPSPGAVVDHGWFAGLAPVAGLAPLAGLAPVAGLVGRAPLAGRAPLDEGTPPDEHALLADQVGSPEEHSTLDVPPPPGDVDTADHGADHPDHPDHAADLDGGRTSGGAEGREPSAVQRLGWSDLPGAGLARGAVDAVGDLAGAALDAVKGKISSLTGALRSGWVAVQSTAGGLLSGLGDQIRGGVAAVGKLGSSISAGISQGFAGATRAMGALTSGFTRSLTSGLATVKGATGALGRALTAMDADGLRAAYGAVKGTVGRVFGGLTAAANAITTRGQALWQGLTGRLDGALKGMTTFASGLVGRLQAAAAGALSQVSGMWDRLRGTAQNIDGVGGTLARAAAAVIDRLLSALRSLWSGISSAWTAVQRSLSTVAASVSAQLSAARGAVEAQAKSMLDRFRGAWTSVTDRASALTRSALGNVGDVIARIRTFSLDKTIGQVAGISRFLKWLSTARAGAEAALDAKATQIAGMIQAGMPEGARDQLVKHAPGGGPASAGPMVQRQPAGTVGSRSSLGFTTMMSRVWGATSDKWGKLSVKEIVVDMLKTMIWPWPAVGRELGALWDDWKSSAHRLFAPRGDSFWTVVQDLWTNLLTLVDFPWAIVKHLVNIVGALMGWVTIILVGAGAIIFGAIGSLLGPGGTAAGAIFGAGAGLGVAGAAGAAVLVAFALTQTTDLVKRLAELFTAALTDEEQKEDIERASDSAVALGVAAIMTAIIWIAGELAGAFLEAVRKIKAGPPKELPPPDDAPNSQKPQDAPVTKPGAPLRTGESPAQFGERLGGESRGKPSRFDYVVEEVNKAGLTQEQAVEATTAATRAMGLRLVVVRNGPDVILSSVMPGLERPIVIAKANGQVVRGFADIRLANPPSLDRPIVLENIREGGAEPVRPTDNPPAPPSNRPYDPTTRTAEELALDRDPAPRPGETPEQAQARARAAQSELALREAVRIHDALGERPPRINLRAHEAETPGAHTIERHGPDIPLKRGDAPAGGRTIEGRITGDPPWGDPANFSYKWVDEPTMNRVVNEHLRANWEKIRSDVAVNGRYEATFNQGNLVGEGFFNSSFGTPEPARPVFSQTSTVTITIDLAPGRNPPAIRIVRAFPNGRGF